MNGYFFDQALNSEYSSYRMHAPVLLPGASTFAPPPPPPSTHTLHDSPLSVEYEDTFVTSPWDIAVEEHGQHGQHHHQPAQVTPKARETVPAPATNHTG